MFKPRHFVALALSVIVAQGAMIPAAMAQARPAPTTQGISVTKAGTQLAAATQKHRKKHKEHKKAQHSAQQESATKTLA
ncbi:hypothetical protein [Pseudomonas asplenii]|uniref:Uncharacterized protein n=1 Tax=Pseudomonas asplenii TaxID=53407 RepID=A0A0M9GFX8_9PSED|nr:hypothetical protein [Pseudomonas fuscovaginae]KPA90217.1 hypothetical protein PF66_03351 [Pseudomonas fuscovaginae]KPA95542.1 hypothetical protein PF70_04443 [Pseudomonas fuscovaginae]